MLLVFGPRMKWIFAFFTFDYVQRHSDYCVICNADRHLAIFFVLQRQRFCETVGTQDLPPVSVELRVHLIEDGHFSDTLWPPIFQLHEKTTTLHMLSYLQSLQWRDACCGFWFRLQPQKQRARAAKVCRSNSFVSAAPLSFVPHMWNCVSRPRHGDRRDERNDRRIRKQRDPGPWNLHGVQCHCIAGYRANPEVPDSSWQEKTAAAILKISPGFADSWWLIAGKKKRLVYPKDFGAPGPWRFQEMMFRFVFSDDRPG